MADRTIYGYIRAVRQLAEFSQLAPDQLTEEHVRRWLLHLKVEQRGRIIWRRPPEHLATRGPP